MSFNFGVDITYNFYPLKSEIVTDSVHDSLALVDAPTIYVFNTKPSRAAAIAGTGALVTISTWTTSLDGRGKSFTIPALDDPDINGTTETYSYYLAINFTLQTGEQQQTVVRLLPMRRILAHHSTARPDEADLNAIHPELSSFFSSAQIEAAIVTAELTTKSKLKTKGYDYASIWNPDELKTQISYQALAVLCLSQIESGGAWEAKHTEYKNMAEAVLLAVELLIDNEPDGVPDAEIKNTSVINLIR